MATSCSITCSHQSADAISHFVILENYKQESLNKELQQNRCCIQALLAAMAQNHAEQGLWRHDLLRPKICFRRINVFEMSESFMIHRIITTGRIINKFKTKLSRHHTSDALSHYNLDVRYHFVSLYIVLLPSASYKKRKYGIWGIRCSWRCL